MAASNWGPDTFVTTYHDQNFVFNDAINWTKGRHSMTIGFEYRRVRDNGVGGSVGGPNGTFVFSPGTALPFRIPSASGLNDLAAGTPSPSSLISFLAGAPAFYTRSLAYPGFGPPGGGFSPYGVRRYPPERLVAG